MVNMSGASSPVRKDDSSSTSVNLQKVRVRSNMGWGAGFEGQQGDTWLKRSYLSDLYLRKEGRIDIIRPAILY